MVEERCEICNEDYHQLKQLNCDHSFCLPCIEKWVANNSAVSCPKCRQTTVLSGAADSLRTKFAGHLRCFQCSAMKELDDAWWCKDCVSTICR
ncbi:unnamed protein product [Soboliphyme baturini]|uniref:RING-type domain-containing protein n=1 Tax=Soboliphyme baturini TaxID=241478 RepID=A0A183J1X2_9BILA|nr:unnamed protein product [Soboliphyme baturini]